MGALQVIRDIARTFLQNATVLHHFLTSCDKGNETLLNDCKERIQFMKFDCAVLKSALKSQDEEVKVLKPFIEAVVELVDVLERKGKTGEYVQAYENLYSLMALMYPSLKEEQDRLATFLNDWTEKYI